MTHGSTWVRNAIDRRAIKQAISETRTYARTTGNLPDRATDHGTNSVSTGETFSRMDRRLGLRGQ